MNENLSEDEIQALLTPESDKLTPLLEDFLRLNSRAMPSFTANLSKQLDGAECTVGAQQVLLTSPNDVLGHLPEEVVDIQVNFRGIYGGLHSYYLDKSEALMLASQVMGTEVTELDAAANSAIGDFFSKAVGGQLSFIAKKFGEEILLGTPNVQIVPKDFLSLTPPVFTLLYNVNLGNGGNGKDLAVVEVINKELAESIGNILHQDEITGKPSPQRNSEVPKVEGVSFPSFRAAEIGPQEEQNLGLLMDVPVTLAVELGRTKWQLRDVLTIGEGSIIELEKQAGEPVDVLVNNNLVARGEVVVVDENFSVRITEIITSFEQMMQKGM